jgi:aconitate decarboxylase
MPDPTADGHDYTGELSRFASDLSYADLPELVVHQAKRSVLDTIGCGLYGGTLPWARTLTAVLIRSGSGGGVVPAWGTGVRLSAADAALVNGTYAHGFELDDLHKEGRLHVGSVTLPATLALASISDRPVSGRDLITAQVAAYEVGARLGLAMGTGINKRGFHITGVIGALTSAVAAARLLGLDPAGVRDALGTAGSLAGGLGAAQFGSSVKRMHAGRAAQAGTYSALLAQQGFRGIRELLEAPHGGFVGTFTAECDRDRLQSGLGTHWETEVLGYKPYAACAASHTSIDAVLAMRGRGIRAEDVASVVIHASTHTVDHVAWPYVPDTLTTAQMNLSYAVACAFLDGRVGADQFQDERLSDPTVLALAAKVRAIADPAIDARGLKFSHAIEMEVTTTDGRTEREAVDHGRGSEHWPLSDGELADKFRDQAGRVHAEERVVELIDTVQSLESLDDVRDLVALTVRSAGRE